MIANTNFENLREDLIINVSHIHFWVKGRLKFLDEKDINMFNGLFSIAEDMDSIESILKSNILNKPSKNQQFKFPGNKREFNGMVYNLSKNNEREAARELSKSYARFCWPELF